MSYHTERCPRCEQIMSPQANRHLEPGVRLFRCEHCRTLHATDRPTANEVSFRQALRTASNRARNAFGADACWADPLHEEDDD